MNSSAHRPDGELRALLDGELAPAHTAEVRQHVAACPACRARLTDSEHAVQTSGALLTLLDPPVTSLRLDSVMQRVRRARVRRVGLIAAAVTLFVVATAGATVGRPLVRTLATRIWAAVHPRVASAPREATEDFQAGVAVVPGTVAEIVFDTTQARGVLRVTVADTVELAIRSSEPVTYRVSPVGVIVHNGGREASYDVVVPRFAPQVRIKVLGRVIFEKVGPRIVAATQVDSAGQYVMNVQ